MMDYCGKLNNGYGTTHMFHWEAGDSMYQEYPGFVVFIGATRPIAGLERSAVSEAPSQYLGPQAPRIIHPLNAFAQICAKVRKWGFPHVSRARSIA